MHTANFLEQKTKQLNVTVRLASRVGIQSAGVVVWRRHGEHADRDADGDRGSKGFRGVLR